MSSKKIIEKLDPKKVSGKFDMSTNVLKKNAAFFAKYICYGINALICSLKFHNELKEVNIISVHKKKSKFAKGNYIPTTILPNISKVYDICMYGQISDFFKNVFSKYQGYFCKGCSAQQCFLVKIDKWKKLWIIELFLVYC